MRIAGRPRGRHGGRSSRRRSGGGAPVRRRLIWHCATAFFRVASPTDASRVAIRWAQGRGGAPDDGAAASPAGAAAAEPAGVSAAAEAGDASGATCGGRARPALLHTRMVHCRGGRACAWRREGEGEGRERSGVEGSGRGCGGRRAGAGNNPSQRRAARPGWRRQPQPASPAHMPTTRTNPAVLAGAQQGAQLGPARRALRHVCRRQLDAGGLRGRGHIEGRRGGAAERPGRRAWRVLHRGRRPGASATAPTGCCSSAPGRPLQQPPARPGSRRSRSQTRCGPARPPTAREAPPPPPAGRRTSERMRE